MMIKDDGDGGGGEKAKAEQHTMPRRVLFAITNKYSKGPNGSGA